MILLLTTRKNPAIDPELAALGKVRTHRVPVPTKRPPTSSAVRRTRPFKKNKNWAYVALREVRELLAAKPETLVVCGDDRARPFAWRVGEQNSDTPVIAGQAAAARILTVLDERGTAVSRRAVHELLDPMRPMQPPVPEYFFDPAARPPLVVSLVENAVHGDSRVQKVTESLADLGYESVLFGVSPWPDSPGDYFMVGKALVLRFPVANTQMDRMLSEPPRSLPAALFGFSSAEHEEAAWDRHRRMMDTVAPGTTPPFRVRVAGRVTELRSWMYRRNRASFTNRRHRSVAHKWRASALTSGISPRQPEQVYPLIGDIEHFMGPALDALKPEAIHVNDPLMLGIAMRAKHRLAALDHVTRIVYDGHEWTPGITRNNAYLVAALMRLEKDHLPDVDACLTVSEPIAEMMQRRFGLAERPTVLTNSPKAGIDVSFGDVREDLGLADSVPLLVYGGGLAEARGVDDIVAALPHLEDAHLAVLSPVNAGANRLAKLARSLGVADRYHRLDYVPADKVTSYLRTADVGIIPFRPHLNSELGIPTKYREYLLAGLPIVATDLGLTAEQIKRTGVGEVAPADAPKKLAKAVRRVLADRATYAAAITGEIVRENSWEQQVDVLRGVYEPLLGPVATDQRPTHRILIGATNSAGQAGEWARALRGAGLAARSMELRLRENAFTHAADVVIPRESLDTMPRRAQLALREVAPADAVIMESARAIAAPEIGEVEFRMMGFREMRFLQQSGRKVGFIFHGSDVRRPDVHMRTHPWSPFADPANGTLTKELLARTRYIHRELLTWDGAVMVSTPDLLEHVPGATWVPVVVDVDAFRFRAREESDQPPVVVHLPSRSALKGTATIEPVLRRLHAEGIIRYHPADQIPHHRVPAVLAEADIFVDQLGMGIFGVAPLEAMATGAVVVTEPGPEALRIYGEKPPIFDVDPHTFEQVLRDVAADPASRAKLSVAGRAFVEENHDGRRSAAAMIAAMGLED